MIIVLSLGTWLSSGFLSALVAARYASPTVRNDSGFLGMMIFLGPISLGVCMFWLLGKLSQRIAR